MSKIILPNLIENLENLRIQEDKIRTDFCLLINSQKSLSEHIQFTHACMDMLIWIHSRTNDKELDDKSIAIAGLRIRLFNSIASSLKL